MTTTTETNRAELNAFIKSEYSKRVGFSNSPLSVLIATGHATQDFIDANTICMSCGRSEPKPAEIIQGLSNGLRYNSVCDCGNSYSLPQP